MNERDFKLAVKAGWIKEAGEPDAGCLNLEQFADLIRADEREACKDAVVQAVEEGLQAAIATEREAILKLADSLGWVSVDDIRARGNT